MNLEDFEVRVHGKYDVVPKKMEKGSVGYDIPLPEEEGDLVLPYNCRKVVDTGVVIEPPENCFELVVPRSSTYDMNVRISNTIGVIDPSYCGQDDTIKVSVERGPEQYEFEGSFRYLEKGYPSPRAFIQGYNPSNLVNYSNLKWCEPEEGLIHLFRKQENDPVVYETGERFCQVLFLPFGNPELVEEKIEEFKSEDRGGFGSTNE